jgi:type 1 fimbria pilin
MNKPQKMTAGLRLGAVALFAALAAAPAAAKDVHLNVQGTTEPAGQNVAAEGTPPPLSAVDQIVGRNLVNQNGATIGRIDDVVRLKADNTPFAIISIKRPGKSNKDITIRYSDLKLMPEEVMVNTTLSASDYAVMPAYDPSRYKTLDGSSPG